jgi:outer membrane autotransporter protein
MRYNYSYFAKWPSKIAVTGSILIILTVANSPSLAQAIDPFSAISAGDMTSTSAVMWTQLRNGTGNTQTSGTATSLMLDVSTDPTFATSVFSSSGMTVPDNGNTLKVLASGLSANTQYFYRFNNAGSLSDTGTFYTNPSSHNQISPLKVGFTGDYDAQYRPYTALNGFGTSSNPGSQGLRYFINLGDIIYERDAKGSPPLTPASPLNDFYRKYIEGVTGVNSDGSMNSASGQQGVKQLLASTGVYTLLDNHELFDKYISGGAPQNSDKENLLFPVECSTEGQRVGKFGCITAYNSGPNYINTTSEFLRMEKAFFNTQATAVQINGTASAANITNLINSNPTVVAPADQRSNGTAQNYFTREWGGAARYIQLDDRSYRDARMVNTTPLIADNPNRTMLGLTQLDWVKQQLSQAQVDGVVWKVVSVSTPIDVWTDTNNQLDNKSWVAGYNAERNEIMKFIEDNKISNVLFLTTDDHISRATRLTYQPAGASASSSWATMSSAFQLLAGPAGAVGPYQNYCDYGTTGGYVDPNGGSSPVVYSSSTACAGTTNTGYNIETTEATLAAKGNSITNNGGAPIGLMGLPGLNNLYREQDPSAPTNPTSKDFVTATTFGYTTLAWDRFANLSVEYLGIDAYAPNDYNSSTQAARLIFGFSVDVPYTIQAGDTASLTDADRHQFTGRSADPLFYNSTWTNYGTLDVSGTSEGAAFANLIGDGSVILGGKRITLKNANSVYSGIISGAGGALTLDGGGLKLTAANTYTGATTINSGVLLVDGSIVSRVTVNSGGLLGGHGSFGGGDIKAGGILSPGNSPGTITSNGNLTFNNGSTYLAEATSQTADRVVVNGSVAINNAQFSLSLSDAAYLINKKYNVLSASGGVTGSFGSLTSPLSFLNGNLSYDPNNVYLSFSLTPFSVVGRTINQRNVGNALTIGAFGPISGPGANILNTLFYGSYQSAQSVMDTVGGAGLAGVQTTAMEVGQMASSTVSDQIAFWRSGETNDMTGVTLHEGNGQDRARSFMAYAPTDVGVTTKNPITIKGPVAGLSSPAPAARTYRAWGSMFGGGANFLSDAGRGTPSATAGYYGGLLGVDYQLTPNALVGVSLGGSSAGFSVGSLSTTGNLTGFHAGLYGAYTMGASYLALNETFSAYSNKTNRSAGGYSFLPYESLTANFGSTEFRTRLEGGHSLLMGGLKATPFIAAEVAAYNANGFSEKSSLLYQSSLALKNNGQAINSLPTFIGLRLSNAYTLENGWRLAPIGSLAYVHEFFPQRQFTNILMSMPGQDFNVAGPRSTYNLVQTKLGAQLFLNKAFALYSDFQGEFSPMSQSYGGTAGMKYYW